METTYCRPSLASVMLSSAAPMVEKLFRPGSTTTEFAAAGLGSLSADTAFLTFATNASSPAFPAV